MRDPIWRRRAARIRNSDREDDIDLKNDLAKYNKILEIFKLMRKDYPTYAWSLRAGGLIDG